MHKDTVQLMLTKHFSCSEFDYILSALL